MKGIILRYWIMGLGLSFITYILMVIGVAYFKDFNQREMGEIVLLSVVGGALLAVVIGLINGLNFLYLVKQSTTIKIFSFYVPAFFWTLMVIECGLLTFRSDQEPGTWAPYLTVCLLIPLAQNILVIKKIKGQLPTKATEP
ncbi:MAG: hypothetical protein COA57_08630 [Flavobacteriales bacterium]|nr:MAG: hypothetical protein COA57_08630 [Flavobacteriales bacterium]